MDKAMCPKGCGEMKVQTCGDGRYWAACDVCQMEGPIAPTPEAAMEEAGRLCYREVRERLPTAEEEVAHLARWGEGAGWVVRGSCFGAVADGWAFRSAGWLMFNRAIQKASQAWSFVAYPHVNGRPVAWSNLPTHSP